MTDESFRVKWRTMSGRCSINNNKKYTFYDLYVFCRKSCLRSPVLIDQFPRRRKKSTVQLLYFIMKLPSWKYAFVILSNSTDRVSSPRGNFLWRATFCFESISGGCVRTNFSTHQSRNVQGTRQTCRKIFNEVRGFLVFP